MLHNVKRVAGSHTYSIAWEDRAAAQSTYACQSACGRHCRRLPSTATPHLALVRLPPLLLPLALGLPAGCEAAAFLLPPLLLEARACLAPSPPWPSPSSSAAAAACFAGAFFLAPAAFFTPPAGFVLLPAGAFFLARALPPRAAALPAFASSSLPSSLLPGATFSRVFGLCFTYSTRRHVHY